MLEKIYPTEAKAVHEMVFDQLTKQLKKPDDFQAVTLTEVLFGRMYWRATWIGMFVGFANSMAGVNAIYIYAKVIYDDIDSKSDSLSLTPTQCTYVIGVIGFIGALLSHYTIKAFSRRTLFIGFHFMIGVCLVCVSIFVEAKQGDIVLVFMSACIIFFQSSNGSGMWVYCGEVVHEVAMGLVLLVAMTFLLLQSLVTNSIIDAIGVDGFFYIVGSFQLFICGVFFFCMKETKGLSMKDKMNLYRPEDL